MKGTSLLGTCLHILGSMPLLPMRLLICLQVTLGTHLASANSCPSQSLFRGWRGVSPAHGRVPVVR